MAIRMMVSKESYEQDPTNVEVVTDYFGHETNRVCHHWDCIHKNQYTKDAPLPDCHERCRTYDPLYMRTTHIGLVLSIGERNGYDDSDFFAVVWNPVEKRPQQIEYASTRGWSYPNGATIDATPEVRAEYEQYQRDLAEAARKRREEREAKLPIRGRIVKVVKGRKVQVGTTGRVVWYGRDKFYRGSNYSDRARAWGLVDELDDVQAGAFRIGIEADGKRVFTNANNVEVIG